MKMKGNFYRYDFHDAVIEKIEINSNKAVLHIDSDGLKIKIICSDTVGITNICMWEDDIIYDARLSVAEDFSLPFLQNIKGAHGSDSPVLEGMLDLAIELTNNIVFHIYCYGVNAETECPDELDGAKVLLWSRLPEKETLYYSDGRVWAEIEYYAICKYEKDNGYYLFKCDARFEVQSDSIFDSVEECKNAFYNGNLIWISK